MLSSFHQKFQQNGEVYLRIKVRPNAAQTAVKEVLTDETVKIDIAAPAERGRANAALIVFLAQEFMVDNKNIKIISGAGERLKLVKIKI